jgi:hypothetical protein
MNWLFSRRPREEEEAAAEFNRRMDCGKFNEDYSSALDTVCNDSADRQILFDALAMIGKYHRGGVTPMPSGFNYSSFNNSDRLHQVAERLLEITMQNDDPALSDAGLQALRAVRRQFDALGPRDYIEYAGDFDPRQDSQPPQPAPSKEPSDWYRE